MNDVLKSPYPFFGGKSKIAALVWQRFGSPSNFVEPFFGSGAVLLGRPVGCGANPSEPWPHCFGTETVNDQDGHISNFWRALQYAPDEVASYADHPVNEIDLHSWHRTLVDMREHVEHMLTDPKYYDAELAGRWCWGISQWIGTGWCPVEGTGTDGGRVDGTLKEKMPYAGGGTGGLGRGPHRASLSRQMPHLQGDSGATGQGVHSKRLSQQMPHLGNNGHGLAYAPQGALYDYFRALSVRLRRVRVVCGDFGRILGPSVTWRHGMTAVFLDPPYADAEHAISYSGGGNVWERVTAWCKENGDNPLLRIALCGYADTWEPPAGWSAVKWKTSGGYGSQGNGRGRGNAEREIVWFSPACIDPAEDARGALSRPIAVRESNWTGTMFEEFDDAV